MPPRDELLPLRILQRVMPSPAVDPDAPPPDPTLLEIFAESFRIPKANQTDDSDRIKDDGKQR